MNIEVIGGGALGLLFAARAASAGIPTVLYARTGEQTRMIASRGIEVRSGTQETVKRIDSNLEAKSVEEFAAPEKESADRWILLAVKQKDINEALLDKMASGVRSGDRLLCLQNGIGHIQRLAEALPKAIIYAAVTTEGARRLGPDSVLHAGKGSTLFGLSETGSLYSSERLAAENKLSEAFASAGLLWSASNEIQTVIYRKLLINAVINPLTAIWQVKNGELLENGARIAAMRAVFDETIGVYASAGMQVPEEWWNELLNVCRATARNRSSMLEDVSLGRETEAKWINGGIVELGRRNGVQAPVNEMLLNVIEGMGGLGGKRL